MDGRARPDRARQPGPGRICGFRLADRAASCPVNYKDRGGRSWLVGERGDEELQELQRRFRPAGRLQNGLRGRKRNENENETKTAYAAQSWLVRTVGASTAIFSTVAVFRAAVNFVILRRRCMRNELYQCRTVL